jgi:hypothetical protein
VQSPAVIGIGGLIFIACQLIQQTRLRKAELRRDRFEMYWRTYDPVTNLQVDEFEMYVYDYMDDDIYQAKYKDNKDGIKRYIMIGQLYEYYAFGYPLRRMGIEDPLGQDWLTLWVDDKLKVDPDGVFADVCEQYGHYYPEFARFVLNRKLALKRPLSA